MATFIAGLGSPSAQHTRLAKEALAQLQRALANLRTSIERQNIEESHKHFVRAAVAAQQLETESAGAGVDRRAAYEGLRVAKELMMRLPSPMGRWAQSISLL
jgi:hypothetical protein